MKSMDIEALVRWAYRDELPRLPLQGPPAAGFRSGWEAISRSGELLAVVQEPDIVNAFGMFPEQVARLWREPHPDALAVYDAVEGLAALVLDLPEGWNPLADLGDLGADGQESIARGLDLLVTVEMRDGRGQVVPSYGGLEAGETVTARPVMRRSPACLVIRHALLGGCPAWEADVPERKVVMRPMGRSPAWFRKIVQVSDGAFAPSRYEIEVDGFDYKRRMPHPDAYQKTVLEPDPVDVVVARAEYELWHAALALLADALGPRLRDHALLPSSRAARPWEGEAQRGRILPSLLVPSEGGRTSRAKRKSKGRDAA